MRRDRWYRANLLHATPRGVAAWTCTRCGMNWAITLVNHGQRSAAYFEQLDATVEQLDATRSVLRQVITLADDAATLSDKSCGTGCWLLPTGPG
jgi:hypothetical protein